MDKRGLTLTELLIAMFIASILVAGIYRVFLSTQRTYTVQDQVVDMQQNVRIAINRMMREIRMAGYGAVSSLCAEGWKADAMTTVYHIVTPGNTPDAVTLVGGFDLATTVAALHDDRTKIYLASTAGFEPTDTGSGKQYICLNGLETHRIKTISSAITPEKGYEVELDSALTEVHKAGEAVYRGEAITYSQSVRDDGVPVLNRTVEGTRSEVAENIEALEFTYVMSDKTVKNGAQLHANQTYSDPLSYVNIRAIQVRLVARTKLQDPAVTTGDGYRRRELTSTIHLRNLSF